MRPSFLFVLCLSVLYGLALHPQDVAAMRIDNETEYFTLCTLSLPDLVPPQGVDVSVDPGGSGTAALPPGKSRLKADMGMVRFVFPAGEYGTAQQLVFQGSDNPPDEALCILAEVDFVKGRWRLTCVTVAQARARLADNL